MFKFSIVLGFFLCSNFLFAQTVLDEVVITANKTEQKLSRTGKVITVLTDSVLQRYQGQTVAELLSKQAGFTIVGSNSAMGSNQELYLRGAGNGNTLVLIDGVPLYDPSYISSGFDLNLLNVCDCDRIEILKGAQSTLYGSDAVAGVINIFTKKGNTQKPIAISVAFNAGSFGTLRSTLGVNGAVKKMFYNIQLSNLKSKGISAAYDKDKAGFDKDGINQNSLLANFGVNITDKLSFKLRTMLNNYKNDIDSGPFTDEKDYTTTQEMALVGSTLDLKTKNGKYVFNYNLAQNKRTFVNDSGYVSPIAFDSYSKNYFGGITQFVELYHSHKINKNFEFVLGADLRSANLDQTFVSYSSYGKYEAAPIGKDTTNSSIVSLYGSGLFSKNNFFLEIGGRLNKHSIYGQNFTYSFNPSYNLSNVLKLFLNVSSGFKAPSLYQLFSPYGNKNLNPELSKSMEFGLQLYSKTRLSNIRALYFTRNLKDVIFFQSLSVDPYGQYINFDKQKDKGVEIEGTSKFGKANFWGNYTYVTGAITTKSASGDTTYNNLYRRPKHQFNLGMGFEITKKLFSSVAVKSVGERIDKFFNNDNNSIENVSLKAYTTIDIYAEYKVLPNMKFYLDLRNVTNKLYFDAAGYATKPFNFMAGISLGF
jgi:vitamin B12 transporter